MLSILHAHAVAKAETLDLKLYSLQKHSHLVPKNEKQQLGKGHWALTQHTLIMSNSTKGGWGTGGFCSVFMMKGVKWGRHMGTPIKLNLMITTIILLQKGKLLKYQPYFP